MIDDFFKIAAELKSIPRQGWISKADIQNPESVADHTFSASMMAMVFGDMLKLDTCKLVRMMLIHDLAESLTGDIMPDQMSQQEKRTLEDTAIEKILGTLPESLQSLYQKVWDELAQNSTAEAILVHEIDKLEMALQASIYLAKSDPAKLDTFFDSAIKSIHSPDLQKIFYRLYETKKR